MTLIAIVGKLGRGKTLALTYLGFMDFINGSKIYSNYCLGYDFTPIKKLDEIENLRKGTFLGDELWSWLDSREFISKKNKLISSILLKSRKRGYDIYYTTQHFSQMEKRIRNITDYMVLPKLNKNETICSLKVYDTDTMQLTDSIKFPTSFIFKLYDTNEEIKDLNENVNN